MQVLKNPFPDIVPRKVNQVEGRDSDAVVSTAKATKYVYRTNVLNLFSMRNQMRGGHAAVDRFSVRDHQWSGAKIRFSERVRH